MARSAHRGFTLVELLVVITIIALLMALLIPAITAAIAQARKLRCMSNQEQIGKATQLYAASYGAMPPNITIGPDGKTPFGWVQGMFAQLGRADLAVTPSAAVNIPLLICPADAAKVTASGGPLSYVVNGGCYNSYTAPAGLPVDWIDNGAWSIGTSPGHPNAKNSPDFIASHDGLSMTISHSENLDASSYIIPANVTDEPSQSILWDPSPGTLGFNQDAGSGKPLDNAHARPSSNHPRGVVVAFCDGSVKFLLDTIDYRVYATLMTSNGAAAQPPGQKPGQPNAFSGFQVSPLDATTIPAGN